MTERQIGGSLADLQRLLADAEPSTHHRIVQALFEQVEVLGPNEVWIHPSVEAEVRDWAAAMTREFGVEVRKTGRGERDCPATTSPILLIPVTNVPSYVHRASEIA